MCDEYCGLPRTCTHSRASEYEAQELNKTLENAQELLITIGMQQGNGWKMLPFMRPAVAVALSRTASGHA